MQRAGEVKGVPQWQSDPLAQWESDNAPEPDANMRKQAAEAVRDAISRLMGSVTMCDIAYSYMDGLPVADKLVSIINSMEDLQHELSGIHKELGGGEVI